MNTKQRKKTFTLKKNFNKKNFKMETLTTNGDLSLENQKHFLRTDDPMDIANELEMNEIDEKEEMLTKETLLIKLVCQEQSLYNPNNEEYRNCQRKEEKWLEISQQLGWTETQVKNKWKAMRDQYCRELKRLKYSQKQSIKWKHFQDLEFLRPYALSRSYRPRSNSSHRKPKKTKSHRKRRSSKFIPSLEHAIEEAMAIKSEPSDTNPCSRALKANMNNDQLKYSSWRRYMSFPPALNSTSQVNDGSEQKILDHHHAHMDQLPNNTDFIFNSFNSPEVQIHEEHDHDNHHQDISLNAMDSLNLPITTMLLEPKADQQIVEEENDTRHVFLNIETTFEKELIALVKGDEILYNIYHIHYRNLNRKREVWRKIAKSLKKSEKQCRQKWKALRDQFIRELKRLRDRQNVEYIPRWKHYDALNFLKQYIRHKNDWDGSAQNLMETSELEAVIEQQLNNDDSLDINTTQHKNGAILPLQGLPPLSGPHPTVSQLHKNESSIRITATTNAAAGATNICVPNNFNEMDRGTYILSAGAGINIDNGSDHNESDGDCDDNDQDELKGFADDSLMDDDSLLGLDKQQKQEEVELQDEEQQELSNDYQTNITNDCANSVAVLHSHLNQRKDLIYNITNHHEFSDIKIIHSHSTNQKDNLQHNTVFTADATTNTVHHVGDNMEYVLDNKNAVPNLEKKGFLAVSNEVPTPSTELGTNMVSIFNHIDIKNQQNNSQPMTIKTASPSGLETAATSDTNCPTTYSAKTQTPSGRVVIDDDDEIDAFFKAIALKIRKAHMPPSDFTNLQIHILRLINDHLGNSNF